jgi:hypothetical protein
MVAIELLAAAFAFGLSVTTVLPCGAFRQAGATAIVLHFAGTEFLVWFEIGDAGRDIHGRDLRLVFAGDHPITVCNLCAIAIFFFLTY